MHKVLWVQRGRPGRQELTEPRVLPGLRVLTEHKACKGPVVWMEIQEPRDPAENKGQPAPAAGQLGLQGPQGPMEPMEQMVLPGQQERPVQMA